MIEEYRKEEKIIERNEFQKEEDLIKIIIKTKENIKDPTIYLISYNSVVPCFLSLYKNL